MTKLQDHVRDVGLEDCAADKPNWRGMLMNEVRVEVKEFNQSRAGLPLDVLDLETSKVFVSTSFNTCPSFAFIEVKRNSATVLSELKGYLLPLSGKSSYAKMAKRNVASTGLDPVTFGYHSR